MIFRIVYNGIDLMGNDLDSCVLNPSLEQELNTAGSLTFTMPPTHPMWGAMKVFVGDIEVYENGELIFFGRIVNIDQNWNNERIIECEGALAFFNDTYVDGHVRWDEEGTTVGSFFTDIVNRHNALVPDNRKIFVGNIDQSFMNYLVTREVEWEKTLDVISQMCIDTNGGWLMLRKDLEEDKIYIDWVKDISSGIDQPVQFGLNLLDVTKSYHGEDICTAVIPRGEQNDEGVYLDISEMPTVSDVGQVDHTYGSNILYHHDGVENHGAVLQVHDFSSCATKEDLYEEARVWLIKKNTDVATIEVEAAELGYFGDGYPIFKVGKLVEVIDGIHFPDETTVTYPMYKISMNLDSGKKQITIGTPPKKELTQIYASDVDSTGNGGVKSGTSSGGGSGGSGSGDGVTDVIVNGSSVVNNHVASFSAVSTNQMNTAINNATSGLASTSYVDNAVAPKANTSDVNTALASKANTSDVITALAGKVDTSTYNAGMANKADKSEIIDVEANPSGTATDDLTTIKIGNTVYDIPGGGSGGEPGLNVIETYGSAGSKSYTITKAGLYAIFATVTYQGSCTITLPNDAITVYSNDLTVSSRISKYLIVELPASSTVTIAMTVGQWNGCCSGVIALKNMEINQVADSVSKADTTASLTLPDDDKMYLVLATCAARSSSDARDNTTGGNPKYDEKVNPSSLSKLHLSLCKGSDSPTYSMYAYDGGIASVIAYELKKDLVYVEANPEGQATEDLDTILIDDTIYKLKGSGGDGQSYVCDVLFDTPTTTSTWSNPIEICTEAKAKEYDMLHILSSTYTGEPVAETILVDALGDTSTPFYIVSPRTDVNVNGVQGFIFLAFDSGKLNFYTGTGNSVTLVKVYGLKFASNVVNNNYLSDYYSTEERVVGRWTDGKPLYQKTIITTNTTVNNWVRIDVSSLNVDSLCNLDGQFTRYVNSKDYWYNFVGAESLYDSNYAGVLRFDFENSCGEITYRINIEATNKQVFTIQYTKSTDTAGTGPTPGNLIYLPALYSEEEREVGVWTDGKPLYQKTVIFTSLTQNGWNNKAHNVANIDKVVYCVGGVSTDDGQTNYYGSGANNAYSLLAAASVTYVNIYVGNYAFKKAIVTFQYTKTTDQPGSGRYLPDGQYSHHYSTSEHIVGTWIDGSTIYERTWTGLSITTNTAWHSTGIDVSFANRIIGGTSIDNAGQVITESYAHPGYNDLLARSMFAGNTITTITLQYTKSS